MSTNATIIAGSFFPKRSPRAVQNVRLVEALGWRGHLIVPRTGKLPAHKILEKVDFDGLRIHNVWDPRGYAVHAFLERCGLQTDRSPDPMRPWALQSGMLAAVLPRPEVMVSISHPLSAHLAGLLAKKTTRRSTPWIAYFSDPWLDMEPLGYISFSRRTRRINQRQEAKVVHHADALIFTNQETLQLFADRYPGAEEKSHVVTQCYDARLYPQPEPGDGERSSRMILRYLGDFYGPRSPRPLIEAALALEAEAGSGDLPWRIELYGRLQCNDQAVCQELLARSRTVSVHGEVDYQQSLALMVNSDALLVIDAPARSSPFLPSKLIDYLGADRPVLGFTAEGAGASLIRRCGGLVADVSQGDQVRDALRQAVELWRQGNLTTLRPAPSVREEFSPQFTARRFQGIADRLLGKSSAAEELADPVCSVANESSSASAPGDGTLL